MVGSVNPARPRGGFPVRDYAVPGVRDFRELRVKVTNTKGFIFFILSLKITLT